MKKSKRLVTIYKRGDFQMSKLEGELVEFGDAGPNNRWPFVEYIPIGKRKTIKLTAHDPYNYLLVVEGLGKPEPPDLGEPTPGGGARDYHMLDPRAVIALNGVINPLSGSFVADYRYNKSETLTDVDISEIKSNGLLPKDIVHADEPVDEVAVPISEDFLLGDMADERERRLTSVVQRMGQDDFRKELLAAYGSRCPITGCDVEGVLQAAHIVPYFGEKSNHVQNGLPLRADVHNLFDLFLISVEPEGLIVRISPALMGTFYEELAGRKLTVPADRACCPSRAALERHYRGFLEKNALVT